MSYNNDTTQPLGMLDPASTNAGTDSTRGNTTSDTAALAKAGGYRSVGQPVGESIDAAAERISRRPGDDVAGDAASGHAVVGVPPIGGKSRVGEAPGLGAMAGGAGYLGAQAYEGEATAGSVGGGQSGGVATAPSSRTENALAGDYAPGQHASLTTGQAANVNSSMSERTRQALQTDPSNGRPADVLASEPEQARQGQPIVDPLSHRDQNKTVGKSNFTRPGGAGNGQFGPNQGSRGLETERGGTYGGETAADAGGLGVGGAAGGLAAQRGGAGMNPFRENDGAGQYGSNAAHNLGSSDMNATSGAALTNTSGWSAGAGTNDLSSSNTGNASTLPAAQQNTTDIIGAEPKWKNAQSSAVAEMTTDGGLPPAGIDTQTSSGLISDGPSARTRAALAADPGRTTTHSVLGSQPKQSAEGEPIVDALSTDTQGQQAEVRGVSAQGYGAQQGSNGGARKYEARSLEGGGVSAEPSARTRAALGQQY